MVRSLKALFSCMFFWNSPNRSLRLRGPSLESLYRLVSHLVLARVPPNFGSCAPKFWIVCPQILDRVPPICSCDFLSLVPSETQNFASMKFIISQNGAVAPARLKILSASGIRPFVPHCAWCENVAVAPARIKISKYVVVQRTLLSSTSSTNVSNYKHSWSSWFLLLIFKLHFCSKRK